MTTEPRLSFSKGEDILSYISHALGYWPVDSLVCITMSGNVIGATLRTNLRESDFAAGCATERGMSVAGRTGALGASGNRPSADGLPADWGSGIRASVRGTPPTDLDRYVGEFLCYLAEDKSADGALLAVFGSRDWVEPVRIPQRKMMETLETALARAGKPVKHSWYVGPEHWRSYDCADKDCCGWPGNPVSRITDSALNAELIFRGSTYESGPQMLARDAADPLAKAPRRAISLESEACARLLAGRQCLDEQFRATLEVWELALSGGPAVPDHGTCGFLLASLESVTVRDSVLVLCSVGPQLALEGAAACGLLEPTTVSPARPSGWHPSADELDGLRDIFSAESDCPVHDFGQVLVGQGRSKPDWGRIARATDVLVYLARAGSGESRAAALTMLAWLQWCRGRGTAADSYLVLALAASPGYRLAVLLKELLGTGNVCGWARNRSTAWNPTPGEAA